MVLSTPFKEDKCINNHQKCVLHKDVSYTIKHFLLLVICFIEV